MNIQNFENEPDKTKLSQAYDQLYTAPALAISTLLDLTKRGSRYSMLYFGWAHEKGYGVNVNWQEAVVWYQRAIDNKLNLGFYYLGHLYLKQKEYSKALEIFTRGAELHYSPAIYCLAEMYNDGTGVERQTDKARSLFEQAIKLGHVFAKRRLATLLMSGRYGFINRFRGYRLVFSAIIDAIKLSFRDSSSERLLA
ncbi:MAG: sel1 repeat family protein [Gammaproteobacteria bacterium]|nr:sel1 repeat family protein [Gammaproteobacteria bacterium]